LIGGFARASLVAFITSETVDQFVFQFFLIACFHFLFAFIVALYEVVCLNVHLGLGELGFCVNVCSFPCGLQNLTGQSFKCAKAAQSLCDELDRRFPHQDLLDAFGIIYLQYWW